MQHTTWSKTKIVATIGPASASPEVLEKMIEAGMNVARINSSHGSYEDHQKVIDHIREINRKHNTHVAILVDLQGPKIRCGKIAGNAAELVHGNEIIITTEDCEGTAQRISINYTEFPKDVEVGDHILLDDGKLRLVVTATDRMKEVKATVVNGGTLTSKKGVNLPNTAVSLPSLTEKDLADLEFALKNKVEWIGLSFVRSVTDVLDLKERIKQAHQTSRVVAKIEKPEAIRNIGQIVEMADAIMVARGDLGVEMPMEEVPLMQKMIVTKAIAASKPVIIATQMMETMITNYAPTRAEVNDVANAVLDGADAVMLSGETSVGKYPVVVIQNMKKIIDAVEKTSDQIFFKEHIPTEKNHTYISDSICFNACVMARQVNAAAIVTMTNSGYTGFKISSHRPRANVFIFTDNPALINTMSLVWGVRGFYYNTYESTDATIKDIKEFLKREKLVKVDDLVINIASMPMTEKGRANMLKLSFVKE